MRTGKNMQVIDSWCARRTLQALKYLNAMISRINQRLLKLKFTSIQSDIPLIDLRDTAEQAKLLAFPG